MVQLSRLALILAVIFLSISASVAARSAPSQPATPVAYTDGKTLNLVDPGTNRVVKSVPLKHEPRALAVDPKENTVWVVTQQRLLKFKAAGEQVLDKDLKELRRSAGGARDEDDEGEEDDGEEGHTRTLALNPYDGSLWISGGKMLLHLDKNGNLTGSNRLRDQVRAFGVALDESVWVLSEKELLHFSRDGKPLPGIKLDKRAKDPEALALDDIGGYIWVSGEKGVLRIKQAESPEAPLYIPIKKEVKGLAVNPFDGTLGVYGKEQLSLYGRDGKLLKSVDLRPYRLDDHTSVSYDAANRSIWVGGKKAVLRFDERGSLLAKFSLKKEGRALGVAPLHLVPGLSLISPPEGTLTNDLKPPVRLGLSATCNGAPCPPELDYLKRLRIEATLNDRAIDNLFAIDKGEATYTPQERLPEGKNTLAAEAVDPFGHRSARITSNFTVDTIPPRFEDVKPAGGSVLTEPEVTITGRLDDPGARVELERLQELGGRVQDASPEHFSFRVPLKEGENSFKLLATDKASNRSELILKVVYQIPIKLTVSEPKPGATVNEDRITVSGSATGPSNLKVRVNGRDAVLDQRGNFRLEGVELKPGPNKISVTAAAPDGRTEERTVEVTFRPPEEGVLPAKYEAPPKAPASDPGPPPPDPVKVAAPVDPTAPTDTAGSTKFLYTGSNPVQTGVDPAKIDDRRVAVLRGKVMDRGGKPLAGVLITVPGHPEYGKTQSRADGAFDMAVNGGGTVTVQYEKDGYLPAQRQVEAPWRDYASVDDVVMVPQDRRVTTVDLKGTGEMLVARGSTVTDEAGTRQATLAFPADVEAEMVLPDGSKKPLPSLKVRATEYTVGKDGPGSMPAPLPPQSGYTYAVELSADEAVEAGAAEVRFSKPVYNYVENYLGFPVGTKVPAGYYDRKKAAWVPSDDGLVIKVLAVKDGRAELDVDGKGAAADAATLQKLGITDEERTKLAKLYKEGQSIWRVPVPHFTPWDYNWPYGPPEGAAAPGQPAAANGAPVADPACAPGSIIECQNQILGENLGVTGTPFNLHYGSDRVPGRKAANILEIPLTGATLPTGLKKVELEINVAGQKYTQTLPAQPGQRYTFTWDGKDAYGRPMTGEQTASYSIGYVYDLVYQQPAQFQRSFGALSGVPISTNRTGREITLRQEGKSTVAAWDARGAQSLGAWTLDALHQYDPESRVLQMGDSSRRRAEDVGNVINTVAGTGEIRYGGDGGPAMEAQLSYPAGTALGPDNSLYIADSDNNRIRKVSPDGVITTVAGNGSWGYSGDGGPASQAVLRSPAGIALGPDNSLYIADTGNARVRKVTPDGTIITVAGNGSWGYSGDGGFATKAQLTNPQHIAVGPEGELYIVDSWSHRIRLVDKNGVISTIAGNSQCTYSYGWCYYNGGYSGEGGPATKAQLSYPAGIALGPDGNLYITDSGNSRIRRVDPKGIITTVAGDGNYGFSGDNGPALEAKLRNPRAVAVDPSGNLYIADAGNSRVRRVAPDGTITTVAGNGTWGYGGDGKQATGASFGWISGIALGPDSSLYIADRDNASIRKVDAEGRIKLVAGRFIGDGRPAARARLNDPDEVAAGADGSFYIADTDNNRIRRVDRGGVITTVAGTGGEGFSGDAGPAIEAMLDEPRGIAVAADGSIYIADTENNRIRRVGTDGIITTMAGSGDEGFSGDAGPAKEAKLNEPRGVAVGADGSIYISDSENDRIRRVGPDGIIATVAGKPDGIYPGDGVPATEIKLGEPEGIVVSRDGSLYIADRQKDRILKVGTDGIAKIVAGSDAGGWDELSGEGGPATAATLTHASGIALAPDGSLYISDGHTGRILRVGQDGIVNRVAGNGTRGFSGDGGPATGAQLNSWHSGIAVDPEGGLYIADSDNHRVRRVASALPGISTGDITVPSEDGAQLFVFNSSGKHLRTMDATTGRVLLKFSYDSGGRIVEVEDVDGLKTRVERDGSGNATAITAPTGERTALSLDAAGYLASVSNPAGETVKLTYGEGGLLSSLVDPRGNTTRFSYDPSGRLVKDEDPAGGFSALSRIEKERGFEVSLTSAMGRKKTHLIENQPNGDQRRVDTDKSGLATETTIRTDGSRKMTAPDGTTTEMIEGPDPRYGMQAPIPKSLTVKTPGGLQSTVTSERQANLKDPSNPLSVTSITDTLRVGDKVSTSTWDAASKKSTSTTPEGRKNFATVDDKGRVILEESPGFAPTSYTHDNRGRLSEARSGSGTDVRKVTYAYDDKDRLKSTTDAAGRVTSYEYDPAGRVTRQTLPDSRIISYTYDKNGNLTSLTPPQRPEHAFTYTPRNQTETYTPPDVGEERTTTYQYNLDKQPTTITRPGGKKIELSYDAGGRVSKATSPEGETLYAYDQKTGNLTAVNKAGLPAGQAGLLAGQAGATLSYTYDGSLPLSETWAGEIKGSVSRKYDNDFRVTELAVNGESPTTYTYDKDDLLTGAGSLTITRDKERGLITATKLDTTTDARTHNLYGELDTYKALSGTTEQLSTTYKRDSLGRITEKTETADGKTATYTYTYDPAGRLVEVKKDGAVAARYTYDQNGNRLTHEAAGIKTEGRYDSQDRLTTYGANQYTYSTDGDLKSKTDTKTGKTTTYNYDTLGNLLSATLPEGKKVEYITDGNDRRIGKKVDGVLKQGFLYSGQLTPVAELDGQGNIISRFIYATKANIPDYMVKGGTTYRIISDHLGSPRLVVNASTGEVAQRMNYDEFGNITQDTNPGFQPFGFAGGMYDPNTKLTRFGARDYDAETGRWTAKDPIGFEGGDTNLYGYVVNDPVNFVDPEGLTTGGLCGNINLEFPGAEGMFQLCEVSDGKNLGITFSYGGGWKTPMDTLEKGKLGQLNGSVALQMSPAESVNSLDGPGFYTGWSAGQGVVGQTTTQFSYDDCGKAVASGEVGIGPGIKGGIPVGLHGGVTNTHLFGVISIADFMTAGTPVLRGW